MRLDYGLPNNTQGGKMFSIDTRSREPIYTQLEKNIVKYINLGIYEKDSALPSVRSLACDLGINPNTVSKAYKNLEQQGVIYTVAGKGVFVHKTDLRKVHKAAEEDVRSALQDAKNAGVDRAAILRIVDSLWEEKE